MAANGYEISILSAIGEILEPDSFSMFMIVFHLVVRPFRVAFDEATALRYVSKSTSSAMPIRSTWRGT
jgi:hypothetical protein